MRLLPFKEQSIMTRSAKKSPNHLRDLAGISVDFLLLLSLNHHAA
jgi:hypothetical protein